MMARNLSILLLFSSLAATTAHAEMDPELAEQVYSVLERANRSADAQTRALATEAFATLKPEQTASYALDALKDPVFEVRAAAIRGLVRLKNTAYAEVLYNELTAPNRDLEREVMPIIALLGDGQAVELALKAVRDPKGNTQNAVIAAFGKLGGDRMMLFFKPLMKDENQALADGVQGYVLTLRTREVLPLYEMILKTGTPQMKARALEALTEFPQGTPLGFVRKLLRSREEGMAVRAAEVLAHHGDHAAAKVLLPRLDGASDQVVIRTLKALVPIASRDMYGALAGFLRKRDTNPEILRLALEIHHRTNDTAIVDTLRRLRQNDNIRTQAVAVYYTGVIEKGRALPQLHEDLYHGDPSVRLAAVEAVGSIASRESIAPLAKMLDDTREPQLRIAIVKALAGIRDKGIVPVLSFLITDNVPEVKRWAITGLVRVGHTDAVPSLKIALNQGDVETRAEAVRAIVKLDLSEGLGVFRMAMGWMPPEKLFDIADDMKEGFLPLVDMALTSSRPEIRAAGLKILEQYPAKEDLILTAALERTRDSSLKIAILERLVAKHGGAELERLGRYVDAGDRVVKTAALRLMGVAKDMAAETALRTALFDSDERTRVTAGIALLALHAKPPRRGRRGRRGRR